MESRTPINRIDCSEESEARELLINYISALYPTSEWEWANIIEGIPLIERITVRAEKPSGHAAGALVRRFRYVIRNDDLQLFNSILDALVAGVAVGFFLPPHIDPLARWRAIATISAVMLKVGKQAATKGVRLEKQHFAVLSTIHDAGELGFEELLEFMNRQGPGWTSEKLQEVLSMLEQAPSLNGSQVRLLISLPEQRWRTSGL